MARALVIGGTGMLAELSIWLMQQNYHVSVIGRNESKMNRLIERSPHSNQVSPLFVDYHNDQQLKEAIQRAIAENGPIDLVVSWIHSTAPNALTTVSHIVSKHSQAWKLFHVRSSSSFITKTAVQVPDNCSYHAVYLGFIVEGNHSRWLKNDEIAEGVIHAIESGERETIVGTMEPWEMRP